MSRKKREIEKPAIHEEWLVWVRFYEARQKWIRNQLKRHINSLKQLRALQSQRRDTALVLRVLYRIRRCGKLRSYNRWVDRHILYPDRPPICGKPSRHPDKGCGCPDPKTVA